MREGPRDTRRNAACAVNDHPACPHLMGFRIVGEELASAPSMTAARAPGRSAPHGRVMGFVHLPWVGADA
jgi:hypothetical protein